MQSTFFGFPETLWNDVSLFLSLGMGMLAHRYHDDNERGAAVGFALSGLAFGVLGIIVLGFLAYFFFIVLKQFRIITPAYISSRFLFHPDENNTL